MESIVDVPHYALTFEWQIKNFSFISNREEDVESVMFKSNSGKWIVKVGLGTVYVGAKCLSVSLGNVDLVYGRSSIFDWEYSFLDVQENPLFKKTVANHNFIRGINSKIFWSDTTGPSWEEVFVTKRSVYLPEDTLTLRLRLWQSENESPADSEYCSSITVMELEKVCIFWDIKRFSFLQLLDLKTKPLYFPISGNICSISFSLKGLELQSSEANVTLYSNNRRLNLSCKFSVLNVNKIPEKILDVNCSFKNDSLKPLPLCLTRRDILDDRKQYLNDDVFTFVLEIEKLTIPYLGTIFFSPADLRKSVPEIPKSTLSEAINQTSQKTKTHSDSPQQKDDAGMNLVKDFQSLFREQTLCDFEIRCKDASFPVHKVVLSSRSPFFRNMFSSNMREDHPRFHHDLNLDGNTINRMLAFLYSDTLEAELTWEGASRLYDAAVVYRVQSLKVKCASILKSGISMLNVFDFLIFADKHGDDELKISGEAFLLENLDEIMISPKWKEFHEQNTELGIIIMKNLFGPSPNKKRRLTSPRTEDEDSQDYDLSGFLDLAPLNP